MADEMNRIRAAWYVLLGRPVAANLVFSSEALVFRFDQKATVSNCKFDHGAHIVIQDDYAPTPKHRLWDAITELQHTTAEAARVIVQQRDLLAQIVEGKE